MRTSGRAAVPRVRLTDRSTRWPVATDAVAREDRARRRRPVGVTTERRREMGIHMKVRRLVLVAAAGAALAVPAAGAGVTHGIYVQIDGKLVNPEHLSAYEAQAGSPGSAHLVQIGGRLIPPAQGSGCQTQAGEG